MQCNQDAEAESKLPLPAAAVHLSIPPDMQGDNLLHYATTKQFVFQSFHCCLQNLAMCGLSRSSGTESQPTVQSADALRSH